MSVYAVLGSTGNVGGSILQILLQSPDKVVHAYCRSKDKLVKQNPGIDSNPNVRIFEGSLDDADLLSSCLAGARAVFVAIAITGNTPGVTIAQDTAKQVIAALQKVREKDGASRVPKAIVLSSASTEHRLMSDVSPFLLGMLYRAFSYIYDDLKDAEKLYRAEESWLTLTFIKPGALTNDEQRGHEVNFTHAGSPVSFIDLAAGFVDVADETGDRYDGKAVAVNATSKDVAFPKDAPLLLIKGLIIHFFPFMHKVLG